MHADGLGERLLGGLGRVSVPRLEDGGGDNEEKGRFFSAVDVVDFGSGVSLIGQ